MVDAESKRQEPGFMSHGLTQYPNRLADRARRALISAADRSRQQN
jgi:hypothetical protein